VDSDLSDVGEGNDGGNLQDDSENEAPDSSDKSERSDGSEDDSDEEEEVGVQGTPSPRTLPIRSGKQLDSPVRVRGMLKRLGDAGRSPTVIGQMDAKTTRRGVRGQPKEGANMVFETVQEFAMKASGLLPNMERSEEEQMEGEPVDYSKVDPSKYKDIFENPATFEEAWFHPCPFQRKKWREAITKELTKMTQMKVWTKIKRSTMPPNRRCVKYKWVLEIKRDGRF